MGAYKLDIFNYLDTSESTINYLRDYVLDYLSRTPLYDIEDIANSFADMNTVLYVDFEVFMGEVKIKEVTVQDNLFHIERERDSQFFKWILESDVIPYVNKSNKQGISQCNDILKDQKEYAL